MQTLKSIISKVLTTFDLPSMGHTSTIRYFKPLLVLLSFCFGTLQARTADTLQVRKEFQHILQEKTDSNQVKKLIVLYEKNYTDNIEDLDNLGLSMLQRAHAISQKIHYSKGVIYSSQNLGEYYFFQKNLDLASLYYFKSIQEAEVIGATAEKLRGMQSLGIIYYSQHKYQSALNYFTQIKKQHKEKLQPYYTLEYLCGLCDFELGNYALAKVAITNSMAFAQATKFEARINECKIALGKLAIAENDFITAKVNFDAAHKFYSTPPVEKAALAIIYEQYAIIDFKKNDIKNAIENATMAYDFGHSSPNTLNLPEVTSLLHKLYFMEGNITKAYAYLRENQAIKDSMYNRDITTEIALAMNAFEFEKERDKYAEEIKEQMQKKRQATIIAGVVVVLMLVFLGLLAVVRKERRKSEALLLNILPKETAAELKSFGRAVPKRHESVSVLFCDVKQFTTISEHLAPEILVEMLDIYISRFDKIITDHGLEKIKTIGDAYMCAGGLHNNYQSHAISAVSAAIEMMNFIKNSELDMHNKFGAFFQFRVGIHTGPVVSGVVGHVKYAYDIWGDTVNIAARMEEKSEPGYINISEATYQLVKNKVKATFRGKLEAKNKAPMPMYFLDV